ncbi:MAG: 1,6-anhydro-N-acetylmuramyl-L-alanine amidase AmpD [Alysiella sp.]|uniref:1,6-anhydro-N-acetylmuramyl-L-alanine amidase AmpD n=1 Tax=Alysiella sp. TaxID=1872483 RepID=UPI0026DBA0B3|nr:1,6-anhydro-N-acetylmuramyl-L-alanine amidase AmpD [Alysiella sp.]MDO4433698.1 1,6-anhydro-N-acetylmuramyl-L-alanine amidase AmpD [Alysiella sp.]
MKSSLSVSPDICIWQNGRWQGAVQRVSPNCCSRAEGEKISLIVLHNISLPPFEYGSDAIERLFTNTINPDAHPFFRQLVDLRVSSHFFVRRDGEIMQFVSCDDMAYHAGVSSFHGREKCNAFSIGIEIEGCDFEPFTQMQYDALETLLFALCQHYPISAITGHQDIAPARKTDPGHFFDWAHLQAVGLPVDRNQTAFEAA